MSTARPPAAVDAALSTWCAQHLGVPAVQRFFGADHLTEVHGLQLADGRRVVLKLRGVVPRVRGCVAVQAALWAAGVPCPRPLAGPSPMPGRDDRWVTAEEWVGSGETRVRPDDPEVYARLLALIVSRAPAPADLPSLEPPVPWLRYDHGDATRTWPPPETEWWDPHRIALPGHVVGTARRVRGRLLAPDMRALAAVVGHGDLSGINVRWFPPSTPDGRWRPVVHDWDSVVALPEAVLAGQTSGDFASHDVCRLASVAHSERFLAAYAVERSLRWTPTELEVAHAAALWVAAYNAAFEHLKGGAGPVSQRLAVDAERRLRLAGL